MEKEKFSISCKPVFDGMGKEIVYMGESGSGQAMKLCNQTAVAIHTLATCESLLLGSSARSKLKRCLESPNLGGGKLLESHKSWSQSGCQGLRPGFKAAHLLKDTPLRHSTLGEKSPNSSGQLDGLPMFNSIMAENEGEKKTESSQRLSKSSRVDRSNDNLVSSVAKHRPALHR